MGTWVSGNSDSRLYAKEEKTYFFIFRKLLIVKGYVYLCSDR